MMKKIVKKLREITEARMSRKTSISIASLLLVFALAACNVSSAVNLPSTTETPEQAAGQSEAASPSIAPAVTSPSNSTGTSGGSSLEDLQASYEKIYQDVLPSVVSIEVTKTVQQSSMTIPEMPFNFGTPQDNTPQEYKESGEGSGLVWDTEGHVITNNHVVEGADTIRVRFSDGTSVPAVLVGSDSSSDLAVVKVEVAASLLKPIQVTDSTKVQVGEIAIAIGNPFRLDSSMTTGIVSGLGRSLALDSTDASGYTYTIPDVIQTDAAINPGNSGGVLVNIHGQLIGVTTAIESSVRQNSGVGYVIPSIIVQKIVPFLIKDGSYQQPWIGISGSDLTAELATAMNLPGSQRGALVYTITANSPAEKAGLVGSDRTTDIDGQTVSIGGDVVIAIDGQTVADFEDLTAYLARYTNVEQTIELTILRDGKEQKTSLTLAARPKEASATTPVSDEVTTGPWLGITGIDMTTDIAKAMGLDGSVKGALIQQITSDSPADKAGLRGSYKPFNQDGQEILIGGDMITAVDNAKVASMNDLSSVIKSHQVGDKITMTLLRDGKQEKVTVELADRP
jgi:serine protease Do